MIQDRAFPLLSPTEAARRLGVTPRRVYALIRDHRLRAQRVAGRILVDLDDVDARVASAPPVGRPFSPRRSWALILLAEGRTPPGIDGSTRSKLRRILDERSLWGIRAKLAGRAEQRRLRAHSSDIARLETEPGVVRTGPRAAAEAGLGLIAPGAPLELYVDGATADRLLERYRLVESSRPNVVLRIVPDEVRAWLDGPLAPRQAIALDLADDLDARAQDVAFETSRDATALRLVTLGRIARE